MGLQIRTNVPTGQGEALLAAVREGLLDGGRLMLAASDALAPTEPDPRHGEHMTETGFVRVIPGMDSDAAEIGYRAFWAVWQNEDLHYHHPNGGQAKFLDTGMLTTADAALAAVAEQVRTALGT